MQIISCRFTWTLSVLCNRFGIRDVHWLVVWLYCISFSHSDFTVCYIHVQNELMSVSNNNCLYVLHGARNSGSVTGKCKATMTAVGFYVYNVFAQQCRIPTVLELCNGHIRFQARITQMTIVLMSRTYLRGMKVRFPHSPHKYHSDVSLPCPFQKDFSRLLESMPLPPSVELDPAFVTHRHTYHPAAKPGSVHRVGLVVGL